MQYIFLTSILFPNIFYLSDTTLSYDREWKTYQRKVFLVAVDKSEHKAWSQIGQDDPCLTLTNMSQDICKSFQRHYSYMYELSACKTIHLLFEWPAYMHMAVWHTTKYTHTNF